MNWKDLEGTNSGLCDILFEHLSGGTEENDKKRIRIARVTSQKAVL
jgi:hypothetical protein